jgi:hypothetical protein
MMNKKEKSMKFKRGLSLVIDISSNSIFDIFSEFERENNLKLHSKQIIFSKHLNNYSHKFQTTMKELISTYEELKFEIENNKSQYHEQTNQIEEKYNTIQNHTEIIYENKMLETVWIYFVFLYSICLLISFHISEILKMN